MAEEISENTMPNPQYEPQEKDSPPLTPPSPADATEPDSKLSRKREREVSLEPATPQATASDFDSGHPETRDSRTPAKKNRVGLDTTVEEEDIASTSRSPSRSPPLTCSPRYEMKVRQISQGVEDIKWRNLRAVATVEDADEETEAYEHDADTGLLAAAEIQPARSVEGHVQTEDSEMPPDSANSSQETAMNILHEEGPTVVAFDANNNVSEDIIPSEAFAEKDDIYQDQAPTAVTSNVNNDVLEDIIPSETLAEKHQMHHDEDPTIVASDTNNDIPEDIILSEAVAEKDQRLKRKLADRATSQGPSESEERPKTTVDPEPLKRARENSNGNSDAQDMNKPSPPPEFHTPQKESSPPAPKLGGFMAYASSASPFASVKGQNVFSSGSKSPPSFSGKPSSSPFSSFSPVLGESSTSRSPTSSTSLGTPPTPRSGFEAFSSSASPFLFASRSKSPPVTSSTGRRLDRNRSPPRRANSGNINAFTSYASGGAQAFSAPAPKRARAESPDSSPRRSLERTNTISALEPNGALDSGGEEERDYRTASFGEKLRAGKDEDDEAKSDDENMKFFNLQEQEITTGEEEEDTLHQVRGKLFSLSPANQWMERGTGLLKLNVRREDGGGARLVMRKEAVYTLLLNVTLFPGMRCFLAQDPRYLRFSVIEDGQTTHYNLRVASAKIAQELLEEITANIP